VDRWLLTAALLLLFLYVVNVAGKHNIAWVHGVRLVAEPLLLLLVGLALPNPRKTLRWAVGSLIVTACFVAGVGLLEQVVGQYRLANIGFTFNQQIRTIQGHSAASGRWTSRSPTRRFSRSASLPYCSDGGGHSPRAFSGSFCSPA
jgi:hypothetical protein